MGASRKGRWRSKVKQLRGNMDPHNLDKKGVKEGVLETLQIKNKARESSDENVLLHNPV